MNMPAFFAFSHCSAVHHSYALVNMHTFWVAPTSEYLFVPTTFFTQQPVGAAPDAPVAPAVPAPEVHIDMSVHALLTAWISSACLEQASAVGRVVVLTTPFLSWVLQQHSEPPPRVVREPKGVRSVMPARFLAVQLASSRLVQVIVAE